MAIEELNSTSTVLTKASILFFYRRRAAGTYTSTFAHIVRINIVLLAAYLISFSLVLLLTCRPLAAYWLQFSIVWAANPRNASSYRCLNEAVTTVAANAVSIAQDLVACGLPAALLWRLQMSRRKKWLLGVLLGLGVVPCVAGFLRLWYTVALYRAADLDATWRAHPILVWTVLETHLGILCACAPALHSYAKEAWRSSEGSSCLSVLSGGAVGWFRSLSSVSSSSAYFWRKGRSRKRRRRRRRRRRSASGHVELEEASGGAGHGCYGGGSSGSGGGGGGGGKAGGRGSSGGVLGAGGRPGGGGGCGASKDDTLHSLSLSTWDEAELGRSPSFCRVDTAAAAADWDLELGVLAGLEQEKEHEEQKRRQRAVAWEEESRRREAGLRPLDLNRVLPAYLGPYRQPQQWWNSAFEGRVDMPWSTDDEFPLSMREGEVDGDIGVAVTTDTITPVPQSVRRSHGY